MVSCPAKLFQQKLQGHGPLGPPSPGGAENGKKGPRWGLKTDTSVTDWDKTTGQAASAKKKH